MVTIKQIADMCGVSRGTVDRVLNRRGNVRPEKSKLILDMIKKLNYRPNPAGKALVSRRNRPTVGIILPSEGIHFFDDLVSAMQLAEQKYKLFGLNVTWRIVAGYDVATQCALMDELKSEVNALILNPINDPLVVAKIDELIDEDIFIVAVNNDIEGVKAHQYVGSDYRNGGQTAAALLKMFCPQGVNIGITMGSQQILGHRQREEGFRAILAADKKFCVVGTAEDNDDDIQAFERTTKMLEAHPEIEAMFLASSGGAYGVCRAIVSKGREKTITVIAFDTIPAIVEMMHKGVVDAAIYQHPRQQGEKAMQIVFDYLINGIKPEHDRHIMKNDIRILQNI